MSIVSATKSPKEREGDELVANKQSQPTQKVLEEDEYLGRMARIIKRDFFPDQDMSREDGASRYSDSTGLFTPGTDRTQFSTTSSMRSRQASCSLRLNDFLDRYTSEDNAYFEKLQKKELKRHRAKYPWLYKDRNKHNDRVKDQLKLPSIREQAALGGSSGTVQMIDWPHNPLNSLFHVPKDESQSRKPQSTINYHSNRFSDESLFKMPSLSQSSSRPVGLNRFSDKVGIDGKLLNGSETPVINGFSFIPAPETPIPTSEQPRVKSETNRFYIPNESPRDELAHRLYMEKVAKVIRTPKTGTTGTPSRRTPSFRKGYAEFSFSPERVKISTPSLRGKK